METAVVWVVGILLLGVLSFWLIVLPFRLSKGLLHKWGYHAHCGTACEQGREAAHVKQKLAEEYRKGLRQGTRMAISFGPEEPKKTISDYNLVPDWAKNDADVPLVEQIKVKYQQIADLTDATDGAHVWLNALAVALGFCITRFEDPAYAFDSAVDTVRIYGGLKTEAPES